MGVQFLLAGWQVDDDSKCSGEEVGGGEEVVEQLSNMRHGLERRREQLEQENGVWDGLAEI